LWTCLDAFATACAEVGPDSGHLPELGVIGVALLGTEGLMADEDCRVAGFEALTALAWVNAT